ncbi:MAG: hypothetical protein HY774_17885 [Acidobacteria bacterium]|nr:hypothetical protein [Acidobacteriota bacterium]HNB71229.1 hypothetical protein [Acidobacteriota bacterium]HNG93507.1 hypothetical protein [Acidobacteriota bacterium]HNH84887.1 hypothetical protein [Acidobacteriota bacterium]
MKVGILVGRENTFPPALIERINSSGTGVTAEYVNIGGVRMDGPCPYKVIVDRISHEIPFYRAYLKNAALCGAIIVNNPFWWSADDKFFNYSLAARLGVAVPRTVLLPQKNYQERVTSQSLRNLEFPLDWQGIVDYVGLPAILKPHDGGGWRDVYRVNTIDELIQVYDRTGQLCMTLQEFIHFDRYVRCYGIGRRDVLVMPYDPTRPYPNQYVDMKPEEYLDKKLYDRVVAEVILLNEALGYDINTVEFAIRDGIPYAIDFMNPAPDADSFSVGPVNFEWMVSRVSDLLIRYAKDGQPTHKPFRWSSMMNQEITVKADAAAE